MKATILIGSLALATTLFTSCQQAAVTAPGADATQVTVTNKSVTHSNARITGVDYSQPISLDEGNKMIGSYLQSVNYPYQDTALRALSFDADTLRAYLANPSITTMKFYFGHQLSYLAAGGAVGQYVGMKPGALTIIAVGLNDAGAVVRNTSNGVYEHAMPCPNSCGLQSDAFLH